MLIQVRLAKVASTYSVTLHVQQSVLQYDRTDKRNYKIMVAAASVLLVQNVISSSMIAGRLWSVRLDLKRKKAAY